jgi:hypothetical protein
MFRRLLSRWKKTPGREPGVVLFEYATYEEYRDTQVPHNRRKLDTAPLYIGGDASIKLVIAGENHVNKPVHSADNLLSDKSCSEISYVIAA